MNRVTLRVGGRNYTVTCTEGEEAHIQQLAEMIEAKLAEMGDNRAAQDSQNLLLAGLLLADELHDTRARGAQDEDASSEIDAERAEMRQLIETAQAKAEEQAARIASLENELAQRPSPGTSDPPPLANRVRYRSCFGKIRRSAGGMRGPAGSARLTRRVERGPQGVLHRGWRDCPARAAEYP